MAACVSFQRGAPRKPHAGPRQRKTRASLPASAMWLARTRPSSSQDPPPRIPTRSSARPLQRRRRILRPAPQPRRHPTPSLPRERRRRSQPRPGRRSGAAASPLSLPGLPPRHTRPSLAAVLRRSLGLSRSAGSTRRRLRHVAPRCASMKRQPHRRLALRRAVTQGLVALASWTRCWFPWCTKSHRTQRCDG